jgi:hypothetical protein
MMTETTGNSGGGLMTQLLSRMMDKLDAMDQRISTPAPTVDPMAALTANLTMIAQIKEIFAPPPAVDPMDSIAKLVTVISGARELSEVISPAPMPDNPLLAMAGPLMGIIGKAMEQKQLAAPPVNAQDPGATPVFVPETNTALPPAVATGPATNPGPSPASGGATEMTPLESALFTLRQMRGLGVDPEIVASAAYEKLGDVEMAFVQRPDWFEQLQQAMPGEEIHKDWYEKVRGFILQWDAEEQAATVTAAAAGPKGKR